MGNLIKTDNDAMGRAIADYHKYGRADKLWVCSNISGRDTIPAAYLFRSFGKMPTIEQDALKMVYGNILDVGAGAGAHSMHLVKKGHSVLPVDISGIAVETMKNRGLQNAKQISFFDLQHGDKFDTILFLMNGVGIAGTLGGLQRFFEKCSQLLTANGQVLLDSSDISYMFGSGFLKPKNRYFGEVCYTMSYKHIETEPFNWLFIDFDTLKSHARRNGLGCIKIVDGPHFDYLARLTLA